jgi:hypothetical protein
MLEWGIGRTRGADATVPAYDLAAGALIEGWKPRVGSRPNCLRGHAPASQSLVYAKSD